MDDLRFAYGQKPVRTALAILLFLGLTVFMGWIARTNDTGLLIDGVIELSPGEATVFFWVLAALCAGLVALAALGFVRHLGSEREVVLGRDALHAPRGGLSRETRTIPYRAITGTEVRAVQRQLFLYVFNDGKKLIVPAAALPDRDAFAQLARELDARIAATRTRAA